MPTPRCRKPQAAKTSVWRSKIVVAMTAATHAWQAEKARPATALCCVSGAVCADLLCILVCSPGRAAFTDFKTIFVMNALVTAARRSRQEARWPIAVLDGRL